MNIEILAVPECPNLEPAHQLVLQALRAEGATAHVSVRVLDAQEISGIPSFAGSPTILVNGRDVDPAAATGCCCRLYANGSGIPDLQSVLAALRHASAHEVN